MPTPSTSLRAAVLTLLVVTAGCVSAPPPGTSTSTTDTTARPLTSVEPPKETTRCHCAKNGRFELHDGYDGRVTVTVVNVTGQTHETVAERTITEHYGVHDFDPVMRYGSDYRVTVRVDGNEAWNRTISRAEGYEVRVLENGTVTVTGYSIV